MRTSLFQLCSIIRAKAEKNKPYIENTTAVICSLSRKSEAQQTRSQMTVWVPVVLSRKQMVTKQDGVFRKEELKTGVFFSLLS